jgi:shikimate dehydrogenase
MPAIDGKTRVAVHLAYPADHVKTPAIFNRRCHARRLNAVLVPWQVKPADLSATIEGLRCCENLAGLVVTVPHKIAAAARCDRLQGTASLIGVVNVARLDADGALVGENFDGAGFLSGLRREGIEPKGMRVLLLGAGGAATAIAGSLLGAGVGQLHIANRTLAKAQMLAQRMGSEASGIISAVVEPKRRYDMIVNATSLGMRQGDKLPVDADLIDANTLVAETIMQPAVTPLMREAGKRGARIHHGKHMIMSQIDLLIDFLFEPGAAQQLDVGGMLEARP